MSEQALKHFVETGWLKEHLEDPDLVVLDCSWHFPDAGDAWAEYKEEHIPGALFFDIDVVCDTQSKLPHMMPGAEKFARLVGEMGIGNETMVVVYDTYGFYCAAARVWWMFHIMGAKNVKVLNGGMPKWLDEDGPVEEGGPRPGPPRLFNAKADTARIYETGQVVDIMNDKSAQILDARSPARFVGELPEPRACLRFGHIPGSINIFFKDFLEFDGSLKPLDEVKKLIQATPLDLSKPIVTTCGSGVTAAVMNIILAELGAPETAMYDGSWAAWGCEDTEYPVAMGPA